MQTGLGYNVSREELLKTSKELSIHELIAYHTFGTVHHIKLSEKPEYLNQKLAFTSYGVTPRRQANKIYIKQELNISFTEEICYGTNCQST